MRRIFKRLIPPVIALGVFIVLILIFTLIIYMVDAPYETAGLLVYISLVVEVIVAAILSLFRSRSKGWLNGLSGGAIVLAFIFLLSIILNGASNDVLGFLKKLPLLLFIAVLAGMAGVNISGGK